MIKLTIDIQLDDESGKELNELTKELFSKLYDAKVESELRVGARENSITIELYPSKCSKKAPQRVLKVVSDSLDKVYSDGSKREINDKMDRVSYIPYERKSYLNKIRKSYGFPEYSHEGSTIICKVADLKDPASKGYRRFIEECNKYLSAMERSEAQAHKWVIDRR